MSVSGPKGTVYVSKLKGKSIVTDKWGLVLYESDDDATCIQWAIDYQGSKEGTINE